MCRCSSTFFTNALARLANSKTVFPRPAQTAVWGCFSTTSLSNDYLICLEWICISTSKHVVICVKWLCKMRQMAWSFHSLCAVVWCKWHRKVA